MTKHEPAHGLTAVRRAKIASDYVVLSVTFLVLFFMSSGYFFVDALVNPSAYGEPGFALIGAAFAGVSVFVLVMLIGMLLIRMQRQIMLGNSLHVEYSDYAWLRDWANQVASEFHLPKVEVMITQDPYINAYAFGFARPYTIVLHSGTIRYLTEEELKVVVVHEMGHIKYGHTNAMVYLQPFMNIPVVGVIGQYICGFWFRRAELTCDRLALAYTRDRELVKQALVKVHVGPDAAKYMNETAEKWLVFNAERPFNRFVQTFSTHPFLVRRLTQLNKWSKRFILS